MRILITGDSHTGALKAGVDRVAAKTPARLQAHQVHFAPLGGGHLLPRPFFRLTDHGIELTQPEYRTRFTAMPPPGFEDVDWIGICAPLHSARVYRHEQWQHHCPPGFADDGSGVPISSALMARLVDDDQRQVQAFMLALRSRGHRVFAIEAPRPFRHHPAVPRVGAAKLLAVDGLYRDRMRRWLAAKDFPIAAVPPGMLDADGFTRADLGQGPPDDHHGNDKFGARMIEQVLQLLTKSSGKASD